MPELPETETIARDVHAAVAGRVIERVEVRRAGVLRGIGARGLASRVAGATVRRAWRRAKAVIVDLTGDRRLVVVPRFTGGLLLRGPAAPDDAYDCVRFRLDDGRTLAYRDVRRLGTIALLDAAGFQAFDRRLGPEPLDPAFTAAQLSARVRSSDQAVKKILMNQQHVAGIGNIYATEALWAAGIDPSRRGRDMTSREVSRLRDNLVDLLRRAIDARGTTFRDYRDARGGSGGFAAQLAAYGRGGEPCRRCGTRLTLTHAIDGRGTVFCHRCQS